MKNRLIAIASLCFALMWGCTADLDEVNSRLDDLEGRVEVLERLCAQMNTNIESLQTLLDAVQNDDYITSVTPIEEGGKVIGYTITFEKNGPITIYYGEDGQDGEDGKDGSVPQIGIRQDADGVYYWTLNGEWLTDGDGNKVPARGEDGSQGVTGQTGPKGEDGLTPQLKIENGYWWVSYDGLQWTEIGPAVSESQSYDIFTGVEIISSTVYFYLSDGTVLAVPMAGGLDIIFDETVGIECAPGQTVDIPYHVVGGDYQAVVECLGQGGWTGKVNATDAYSGTIEVTAPEGDETEGKILVFVSSAGQTIVRTLLFNGRHLEAVVDSWYIEDGSAEKVTFELRTNIAYGVAIDPEAEDWVTYLPETKSMRTDYLTFSVAEYPSGTMREAVIYIYDEDASEYVEELYIYQQSADSYEYNNRIIEFKDLNVKASLVAVADMNGDNEISYGEAADCVQLPSFSESGCRWFGEFRYFTLFERIPEGLFSNCPDLQYLVLPETTTLIQAGAFSGCGDQETPCLIEFTSAVPPEVEPGAFDGSNVWIVVPEESLDAYLASDLASYILPEQLLNVDITLNSAEYDRIYIDVDSPDESTSYILAYVMLEEWNACGGSGVEVMKSWAESRGMQLYDYVTSLSAFVGSFDGLSATSLIPDTEYVFFAVSMVRVPFDQSGEIYLFDCSEPFMVWTTATDPAVDWYGTWHVTASKTYSALEGTVVDSPMEFDVEIFRWPTNNTIVMTGWLPELETRFGKPLPFGMSYDDSGYLYLTNDYNDVSLTDYLGYSYPEEVEWRILADDYTLYYGGVSLQREGDNAEFIWDAYAMSGLEVLTFGLFYYDGSSTWSAMSETSPSGEITMTKVSDEVTAVASRNTVRHSGGQIGKIQQPVTQTGNIRLK